MAFRKDLVQISSWIKPNTKVLDLGCGSGELLRILQQEKNIEGYGIDNDMQTRSVEFLYRRYQVYWPSEFLEGAPDHIHTRRSM